MIGEVIYNDEDFYFTIAYILLTTAIVGQVVYYTFVIHSYQVIRRKIIEKGRLLQITPVISIATVCMEPNHLLSYPHTSCSVTPPVFTSPDITRTGNKDVPPPYIP